MGRPRKKIDPDIVRKLAAIHCTNEEIAAVCGCSADTIERRFAGVIKNARAEGRSSLRRHQWALAQKGNATMCIWLGKQLLGQTDRVETPPPPVVTETTIVYKTEWGGNDEPGSPNSSGT